MSKRERDDDNDDGEAPDYSGLDRVAEADAFEPPTDGIRMQTLQELKQGINAAAAGQIQEEKVFGIAMAANFTLVRLNHSSGTAHPSCFDTQTTSFIVDKPLFQTKMPNGDPAAFVYSGVRSNEDDCVL